MYSLPNPKNYKRTHFLVHEMDYHIVMPYLWILTDSYLFVYCASMVMDKLI